MSLETVRTQLDRLLTSPRGKVLLLTGPWGCGKTHQWRQAALRAEGRRRLNTYAYVSLFGLNSLAEVRRRISEELVSSLPQAVDVDSIESAVKERTKVSWGRTFKVLKYLPALPYMAKVDSLLNDLSFLAVRQATVCLDDLERAGSGLPLADVLGLANFLKEERGCRVVLITNDSQLGDDLPVLRRFMEKASDEHVTFKPTVDEATEVGLEGAEQAVRESIAPNVRLLKLTNIRVIRRIAELAAPMLQLLEGCDRATLDDAAKTLVLFGAAHFAPAEGFPPIDIVIHAEEVRYDHLRRERNDVPGPEDLERRKWATMLDEYGYGNTSEFDQLIGNGVIAGYFEEAALRRLGDEHSKEVVRKQTRDAFQGLLNTFWWSTQDGPEILDRIELRGQNALQVIGPMDLQTAYQALNEAGRPQAAEHLLQSFVETHRPDLVMFEIDHYGGRIVGRVAEVLRASAIEERPARALEQILDSINLNEGFDPADIRSVTTATREEIEGFIRTATTATLRKRMLVLWDLGRQQNASVEERNLHLRTSEVLARMTQQEPLLAVRLGRFLPRPADIAGVDV